MAAEHWKLKPGAQLDPNEVAKIACALKSLAVYTSMVCEQDGNPDDLKRLVEEGLEAMEQIFEM